MEPIWVYQTVSEYTINIIHSDVACFLILTNTHKEEISRVIITPQILIRRLKSNAF